LLRQPLHHVVAIVDLLGKRRECALGVTATTHIDEQKGQAVPREVYGAIVIAVADIRGQREDARRRCALLLGPVDGGVQPDSIPQRDANRPLDIDAARRRILGVGCVEVDAAYA
jgi:hypothetical protein